MSPEGYKDLPDKWWLQLNEDIFDEAREWRYLHRGFRDRISSRSCIMSSFDGLVGYTVSAGSMELRGYTEITPEIFRQHVRNK